MGDSLRPKCGVGALVLKDGKILLGKRKNAHGAGSWGSGGGHLEYGESMDEAVKREIYEEAGIEIQNLRFLAVCNFMVDSKHFVDISFLADWKSGEPVAREPDKHESWGWYDLDNLPTPLFGVVEKYIEAMKTGCTFFDLPESPKRI